MLVQRVRNATRATATLLRAVCLFRTRRKTRAARGNGFVSRLNALFACTRSLASSRLNKRVEPILTTVNVTAPYHARVHCFLSIYTRGRTYVRLRLASACTRGVTRLARVGEGERARRSGMQRVSYILHSAPTRAGLTCAFGCACTRHGRRRLTSYDVRRSAVRRSL